jgi:hypothetical protein
MNHLSRRHSGSSALHPQVMDDTPTLIEVPLARVHPTDSDNQVHAEILRRYSVLRYVVLIYCIEQYPKKHSSVVRKATMPTTVEIETFREIGVGLRGDGTTVTIILNL